jgi:hypothetical protein
VSGRASRYVEPTLHSAREVADKIIAPIVQADHLQHGVEPLLADRWIDPIELGMEAQVSASVSELSCAGPN